MIGKGIAYALGILSGFGATLFIEDRLGISDVVQSADAKELIVRMESVEIEAIRSALFSGRALSGDDHAAVRTDGKRYILGGWIVEDTGIPYFYWTGASLPDDVSGCKRSG